jgi:signal transduction histidine kinase
MHNVFSTVAGAAFALGLSLTAAIPDEYKDLTNNGTGILPEVKEKMFNPFFTTKPPGEGTGLGLSISHDVIVKQHGGSIEVDTQPDEYTEITVTLPRAAASLPEHLQQWRFLVLAYSRHGI